MKSYAVVGRALAGLLLLVGFVGCSAVSGKVVEIAGNDLQVTSDLAKKYNKPNVALCADFMLTKVKQLQASNAEIEALRNEPTAGLMSAALKAAIIADHLRELESINGPTFKKDFQTACAAVSGDIMFNIMQDAAR